MPPAIVFELFNIVLEINYNDHNPPHVHVKAGTHPEFSMDINPPHPSNEASCKIFSLLNRKKRKTILYLLDTWREELLNAWEIAQLKQPVPKIVIKRED